MSTEPTIRAAIIEKAARAKFYRAHPEYPAGENLTYNANGGRMCRSCLRQKARDRYWKDPEKARARVREQWLQGKAARS